MGAGDRNFVGIRNGATAQGGKGATAGGQGYGVPLPALLCRRDYAKARDGRHKSSPPRRGTKSVNPELLFLPVAPPLQSGSSLKLPTEQILNGRPCPCAVTPLCLCAVTPLCPYTFLTSTFTTTSSISISLTVLPEKLLASDTEVASV